MKLINNSKVNCKLTCCFTSNFWKRATNRKQKFEKITMSKISFYLSHIIEQINSFNFHFYSRAFISPQVKFDYQLWFLVQFNAKDWSKCLVIQIIFSLEFCRYFFYFYLQWNHQPRMNDIGFKFPDITKQMEEILRVPRKLVWNMVRDCHKLTMKGT